MHQSVTAHSQEMFTPVEYTFSMYLLLHFDTHSVQDVFTRTLIDDEENILCNADKQSINTRVIHVDKRLTTGKIEKAYYSHATAMKFIG